MAFRDIYSEIRALPKMNLPFAQTLTNRALEKIYDESIWSFQLGESGWVTPGIVAAPPLTTTSGGTITTTFGSNKIVGDAQASAAWASISPNFPITTMQIRLPAYAIYSIIAQQLNTPSAGLTTLTIERPWMEPYGVGLAYMMYQCYFPAPTSGFKRWLAVRDFTNAANLWTRKNTQESLDAQDPQRTVFQNPSNVVPYKIDTRPGSSTLGRMLFELYPQPLSNLPYALYFVGNPDSLVNPGDQVQPPLTDELVIYRAKEQAYLWCEENKGRYPELQKSDWGFLAQAANELYKDRIKDIRKTDRDLSDAFVSTLRRKGLTQGGPFFSAITGEANVGAF